MTLYEASLYTIIYQDLAYNPEILNADVRYQLSKIKDIIKKCQSLIQKEDNFKEVYTILTTYEFNELIIKLFVEKLEEIAILTKFIQNGLKAYVLPPYLHLFLSPKVARLYMDFIDYLPLNVLKEVEIVYSWDNHQREVNLLTYACIQNDEEKCIKLIKKGFDINELTKDNSTPLIWACYKDNTDIVKLLLTVGVKNLDHVNNNKNTALLQACAHDNTKIIQMLLNAGVKNLDQVNNTGYCALKWAFQYINKKVIFWLIQAGAKYYE